MGLNIEIITNNQSDLFLDLMLFLKEDGHTVKVTPHLPINKMNKVKIQIEFLYLQIESLDEFAFQNLKPKQREMQIRTLISSAAVILIRTNDEVVSYANLERCMPLINAISAQLYPRLATAINRCYEIKKTVKKYGEKLTEDRLAKLVTETVDDCFKALDKEVFSKPESFLSVTGKGGTA